MKPLFIFLTVAGLLAGCAPAVTEFYPDHYYAEDGIYQNRLIDFTLTLSGGWLITTDPNRLERAQRKLARSLNQQGVEMLFVGYTPDMMHGVRALAANLNLPARTYAEHVWNANHTAAQSDSGLTEMLVNNIPMTRWLYTLHGLQYAEYFFTFDTYNLRLAFWTTPDRFDRFLPVYTDIMATISYGGR
jgi:hypothetical protein